MYKVLNLLLNLLNFECLHCMILTRNKSTYTHLLQFVKFLSHISATMHAINALGPVVCSGRVGIHFGMFTLSKFLLSFSVALYM